MGSELQHVGWQGAIDLANKLTAARALLLDQITALRMAELDAVNLPADIDTINTNQGDPSGDTLISTSAKLGDLARSLALILGARWDAGGDLGTDILAIINAASAAAAYAIINSGLSFRADVTSKAGCGANDFICGTLIGVGAGAFVDATAPYRCFVFMDSVGGIAPQGETQTITAYDSATGKLTTAAFTATVEVGDTVIIMHPRIAELASILANTATLITNVGSAVGHALPSLVAKIGDLTRSLDLMLGARWDGAGDLGTDIAALLAAAPVSSAAQAAVLVGQCDGGMAGSTTTIVCAQLAGFGDTKFRRQWRMAVVYNANAADTAPEMEIRAVTAYTSATGTFTTEAFSANVEANDLIVLMHDSVANKLAAFGVAEAGSSDTLIVDTVHRTEPALDHWRGLQLMVLTGANRGLSRPIVDFDAANDILTVAPAFPWAIAVGALYLIHGPWGPTTDVAASTTTANWQSGVATSGLAGGDLVTIGADNVRNEVLVFSFSMVNLTPTATITVRMYMQINGVATRLYLPNYTFTVGTDPDGIVIIESPMGIHEALRIEIMSDNAGDNAKAIPYDYMLRQIA